MRNITLQNAFKTLAHVYIHDNNNNYCVKWIIFLTGIIFFSSGSSSGFIKR